MAEEIQMRRECSAANCADFAIRPDQDQDRGQIGSEPQVQAGEGVDVVGQAVADAAIDRHPVDQRPIHRMDRGEGRGYSLPGQREVHEGVAGLLAGLGVELDLLDRHVQHLAVPREQGAEEELLQRDRTARAESHVQLRSGLGRGLPSEATLGEGRNRLGRDASFVLDSPPDPTSERTKWVRMEEDQE